MQWNDTMAPRLGRRGFTLIELMVVVATLAILAVVAIPAYIKYMRRARTTEAVENLALISRGAATYYATIHVFNTGQRAPCQFPGPVAVTPTEATCCSELGGPDKDGDDRCDPRVGDWNDKTWAALTFEIVDQHYFVYAFDAQGALADAIFTASAHGDLDCDGTQSTFQRIGFGDPQATQSECSMYGSAAFYIENETE